MFNVNKWNFTIVKDNEIKTGQLETKCPASLIALFFEIQGYHILTLTRAAYSIPISTIVNGWRNYYENL